MTRRSVWDLLDVFLSGFRWYRRMRGGHWELVYVRPPVSSDIWVQREHGSPMFFAESGPLACEDHTPKGGEEESDG